VREGEKGKSETCYSDGLYVLFFVSYQNSEVNKNVGWVGTKWKPTVPLKNGAGFHFIPTHPTLETTTKF